MNRAACEYPTYSPTKANPGGNCGKPPTHAAPLGQTGRYLSLCPQDRAHRVDAIPIEQVPEDP